MPTVLTTRLASSLISNVSDQVLLVFSGWMLEGFRAVVCSEMRTEQQALLWGLIKGFVRLPLLLLFLILLFLKHTHYYTTPLTRTWFSCSFIHLWINPGHCILFQQDLLVTLHWVVAWQVCLFEIKAKKYCSSGPDVNRKDHTCSWGSSSYFA